MTSLISIWRKHAPDEKFGEEKVSAADLKKQIEADLRAVAKSDISYLLNETPVSTWMKLNKVAKSRL